MLLIVVIWHYNDHIPRCTSNINVDTFSKYFKTLSPKLCSGQRVRPDITNLEVCIYTIDWVFNPFQYYSIGSALKSLGETPNFTN